MSDREEIDCLRRLCDTGAIVGVGETDYAVDYRLSVRRSAATSAAGARGWAGGGASRNAIPAMMHAAAKMANAIT